MAKGSEPPESDSKSPATPPPLLWRDREQEPEAGTSALVPVTGSRWRPPRPRGDSASFQSHVMVLSLRLLVVATGIMMYQWGALPVGPQGAWAANVDRCATTALPNTQYAVFLDTTGEEGSNVCLTFRHEPGGKFWPAASRDCASRGTELLTVVRPGPRRLRELCHYCCQFCARPARAHVHDPRCNL